MLVSTTRTVSAIALRAGFYAGLFFVVALVHVAITSALRAAGWGGGASLFVSGAAVLGVVLVLVNAADYVRERRAARRELERMRQGLPSGPCCVVWRVGEGEADMPWEPIGQIRARYPALARRLGVEGVAIVEYEISAEGAPKNVHCVYAWPSDVFYDAAREALAHARFKPKLEANVRFGAAYRMPFVFRIAGAAKLKDSGRRARTLRPAVIAAERAVEKLRRSA
ncbi:MAG: energy transducer TonB [Hyphomonadaceae bacterium]